MIRKAPQIEIKNLAVGLPGVIKYGDNQEIMTGICKKSTKEAFLTKSGFIGDDVANVTYHGGPDRAVCVYPYEHYLLWERKFLQPLTTANFGENITVTNMLEKDVHIGDIYRLGEAVIQITQGRIPCSTITKRTGNPSLLKEIIETCYTGYLCRVLEEGLVQADSTITLIEQHPKKVSIFYANQVYYHRPYDIEGIKTILSVKDLANEWRKLLQNRLNNIQAHL